MKDMLKTVSETLPGGLAYSSNPLYTHCSRLSERRWHVEHMGLSPSHRALRSLQGSQASAILRRLGRTVLSDMVKWVHSFIDEVRWVVLVAGWH